jgi:hypothetical protein
MTLQRLKCYNSVDRLAQVQAAIRNRLLNLLVQLFDFFLISHLMVGTSGLEQFNAASLDMC